MLSQGKGCGALSGYHGPLIQVILQNGEASLGRRTKKVIFEYGI